MSGERPVHHIPIVQTGLFHHNARKIGLSTLGSNWSSRLAGSGDLKTWGQTGPSVEVFRDPPKPDAGELKRRAEELERRPEELERRSLPKEFGLYKADNPPLGRSNSLPPPPMLGSWRGLRECERELTSSRQPFTDLTQVSRRPSLVQTDSGKFYVYQTEKQDRHCPVHGCQKDRTKQDMSNLSRSRRESILSGSSNSGTQVKTRKIEMKFGMEPLRAPSLIRSTSVNAPTTTSKRKESSATETRKSSVTVKNTRRHENSGTESVSQPPSQRRREGSSAASMDAGHQLLRGGPGSSGTEAPERLWRRRESTARTEPAAGLTSWWKKPPSASNLTRTVSGLDGGARTTVRIGDEDGGPAAGVTSGTGERRASDLMRGPGRFSLRLGGSGKASLEPTRSFLAPTFASLSRSLSGQSLRPRLDDLIDPHLGAGRQDDSPPVPPQRPLRRASSHTDLGLSHTGTSTAFVSGPPRNLAAPVATELAAQPPPRLPPALPVFAPPLGPPPQPRYGASAASLPSSSAWPSTASRPLSGTVGPTVAEDGEGSSRRLPVPSINEDVTVFERRTEAPVSREWPYSSILKTPGRRKSGMKHVEFLDNLSESEYVAREY